MKKIILCCGAIFLLLFACKEHIEEVVALKYDNNSPKLVKYYKTTNKEKILTKEIAYYPNKKKLMEGEFKDNQRNGKWISWYDNGNKWSETVYNKGIRDGINTTWYENGKKRYEGNYQNDIKTGIWKFWNEEGLLLNQFDFSKK